MNISLIPYTIIKDTDYSVSKIVIKKSDFKNIPFQDGRIIFTFINCRFQKIEIENTENIDFRDISILFINCFIEEILVETISTTNISILFYSSILKGRIKNSNLKNVTLNNCLLKDSIYLLGLNSVYISFTEENIFPIRWKRLFKKIGAKYSKLIYEKQSYNIDNAKNIVFSFNENTSENSGLYKILYASELVKKKK